MVSGLKEVKGREDRTLEGANCNTDKDWNAKAIRFKVFTQSTSLKQGMVRSDLNGLFKWISRKSFI